MNSVGVGIEQQENSSVATLLDQRSVVAEVPMVIPHFALLFGFIMIFVAIVVRFRSHVAGTLVSEIDTLISEHSDDDPAASDGAKN